MATRKTKKTSGEPRAGSGDDLLAAILAEPENLELRLVHADSLIERGDPRGRFIAEQCALSKLDVLDERYASLLASTRRLQAEHAATWLGPFMKSSDLTKPFGRVHVDRHFNAAFENGFVSSVAVPPEAIATHWAKLRAREPIDGMHLVVDSGLQDSHRALKEPHVLRTLKVSPEDWFTASSIGSVLAWGMPRLRDVDFSGCDASPTGCAFFANEETELAEHFPDFVPPPKFEKGQIRRLVLRSCNALDDGARTLFAAANLEGLVELDLAQNKITQASTLEALRASKSMAGLRRLGLSGNNQLDVGALAGWKALGQLERISLPQSTTRAAFTALFDRPSKTLRELELASAKELLKTPDVVARAAQALTHLDIGTTSVGDDGFRALLEAPALRPAMFLHANGCSLSDAAVEALVSSQLGRLVTLDLSSNKLTDRGLELLADWPGLEHVTELRLGNNRKLGRAGYDALLKAKRFQPTELDVGKTPEAARLRERFGEAVVSR